MKIFSASLLILSASAFAFLPSVGLAGPSHEKMTPSSVLEQLKAGNKRFVSQTPLDHNYKKQIKNTKLKQKPDAVVLACMDSRTIPELAFDQGIGSIFTLRVAGNVANQDIIGSMEYAAKVVGSKLIVVMGHDNCGAVTAACKGVRLGNLSPVLRTIYPAVAKAKNKAGHDNCKSAKFISKISNKNVLHTIKMIRQDSPILDAMVKSGEIKIVGATYHLKSGRVEFFDT